MWEGTKVRSYPQIRTHDSDSGGPQSGLCFGEVQVRPKEVNQAQVNEPWRNPLSLRREIRLRQPKLHSFSTTCSSSRRSAAERGTTYLIVSFPECMGPRGING